LVRKRMPGLREARESRNLTVRKLAEESHVSYPNISRIEHGHQAATPETARKLARVLGVEVEELYEGFASWEIPDEKVRALYEETYGRLRSAERRAYEGRPTLFDELLDDRIYELIDAAEALPLSAEKERLRKQVQKMARRTAAVLFEEAEIAAELEKAEADRKAAERKAEAKKLLEAGQTMVGAA
jgi:transcriptional regulator with XRE-family HTH domain